MTQYEYQAYRLLTYDLWSDGEGGVMVNDKYDQGIIVVQVVSETYNVGSPHEFTCYSPADDVLNEAVGCTSLDWDGDSDYVLYAEDDGNPACELVRLAGDEASKAICEHLLNPVNFPKG